MNSLIISALIGMFAIAAPFPRVNFFENRSSALHEKTLDAAVVIKHPTGGFGSGFIISPDGYLLTCEHVAKMFPGGKLYVETRQGKAFTATVIKMDKAKDLALAKIDGVKDMAFMSLGDMQQEYGDTVMIVGYGPKHGKQLVVRDISFIRYDISAKWQGVGGRGVIPGDSGCALIDTGEKAIGVVSAEDMMTHQTLFTDINHIKAFLDEK